MHAKYACDNTTIEIDERVFFIAATAPATNAWLLVPSSSAQSATRSTLSSRSASLLLFEDRSATYLRFFIVENKQKKIILKIFKFLMISFIKAEELCTDLGYFSDPLHFSKASFARLLLPILTNEEIEFFWSRFRARLKLNHLLG